MKSASVIVLLSLASSSFSAGCQGAQFDSVLQCYSTFFAAYGMSLPTPTTIPEYWDFHKTRMGWFDQYGVKVQQKVCDIGNVLVDCLQPNWDCINVEMYTRMGQTTADADNYKTDLYVTQYQCSPRGLQLALKVFNCMDQTRLSGGQEAGEACEAAIPQDFINYGHCGGYNVFLDCMYQIYLPSCGPDGAEFFCGTTRAGLMANDPTCDMKGELNQCPGVKSNIAMKLQKLKMLH
ncbi:irg-3 [Pristionchus pacificus]|uniref:Irg-3 n=1 Tax=Pristionchus pacificus TaxID=54126 RepID=A0A454XN22_PRIPA|nr:irg-3 [Pristionchus pacificus]|eukprot:PDM74993.1 irg-3 [Pristionchus pacificus]